MEKPSASMWRRIKSRYNLIGSVCKTCSRVYFPSRIVCRKCGRNTKMEETKLSGEGEIYSFTRIHTPPEGFKDIAPYSIVAVKMKEGPIVEGHIVNVSANELKIGMKVKTIFRKMLVDGDEGLIFYHFKFEPMILKNS